MKRFTAAMLAMASIFGAQTASAVDFNVRIINLSNGIYYTPFLVAAHPAGTSIFTVGQPASANLQAMAEGGDIAGLVTDLDGLGATIAENPAGGLLAPAMETNVDLNTDGTSNELLTIVAMLLPTNDAFAGLNAVQIPTAPGTYVYDVPAYDAGTEANDELITGGGAPGAAGILCRSTSVGSSARGDRWRLARRHTTSRPRCALTGSGMRSHFVGIPQELTWSYRATASRSHRAKRCVPAATRADAA